MTPDIADFQLKTASGFPFYNTSRYTMDRLVADAEHVESNLSDYVRGFSPDALDVFEKFDFFTRIESLHAKNLLFQIVKAFRDVDLGPDVVNDIEMGSIYENLLRRFSEMSNETAGEHFSPCDGLELAVDLLIAGASSDLSQDGKVVNVYDPCAGTGGALSMFKDRVNEYYPKDDVYCYGQELNPATFATCKADILLRGGDARHIAFGNTLTEPAFPDVRFGCQISNPPYGVDWKKSKRSVEAEYRNEGYNGRFGAGLPRVSDGQLLFIEHMVSKMRPAGLGGGRIAVFMNGSPLFTGAAGSGESDIRKWLLHDLDLVEAIVAMPNDFFYNTGIATYIWVLR